MSPGTKGTGHSASIIQWQNMRLLTAQCGFDSRWRHSPCHSIPIGRGTRLKIWKVWVRVPPMAPKYRDVAQLVARSVWVAQVAGAGPVISTICGNVG